MAFLKINGNPLPPCKRGVKIEVSTVVNAGRNSAGAVVGQRIGRDLYKIDTLEWSWLSADEWARILQLMKSFRFDLTFTDPITNGERTIIAYCGDRSAEPYWVDHNGHPTHYRNCKVNLVDTGA